MSLNLKDTCILYFTTQLQSEKFFSSKKRKQEAIQKVLFEKTLSEIQRSKLSYIISDGKAYGSSFGERLKGAVSGIFQLGYQNIIIVGDDTPNLSASDLTKAHQNLEQKILTIGPSEDGGSYLISLNKESFERGIFENLSWQTCNFQQQLIENLEQNKISYQLLQSLIDLDDEVSLSLYLNHTHFSTFQKILSGLYHSILPEIKDLDIQEKVLIQNNTDRGPPVMVY